MLARMDAAEKAQGIEICQKELTATFKIVANGVRSGQLAGYQVFTEKSSGMEILYKTADRFSMSPLAALANDKVFPMPAPLDPHSTDAMVRILTLGTQLREIAASVAPASTPA